MYSTSRVYEQRIFIASEFTLRLFLFKSPQYKFTIYIKITFVGSIRVIYLRGMVYILSRVANFLWMWRGRSTFLLFFI